MDDELQFKQWVHIDRIGLLYVLKVIWLEGSIFRMFYIPMVL